MTRSKSTQAQTQQQTHSNTNTYGYMPGASSAEIDDFKNFKFTADPSIGHAFGSAKSQIANSFNNPIGGVYTPQMRDRILRSSLSNLAMQESQAKSAAHQQLQGAQFGQRAAVASMTAPRFVNLSSSGTGTGTSTGTRTDTPSSLDTMMQLGSVGVGAAS